MFFSKNPFADKEKPLHLYTGEQTTHQPKEEVAENPEQSKQNPEAEKGGLE